MIKINDDSDKGDVPMGSVLEVSTDEMHNKYVGKIA